MPVEDQKKEAATYGELWGITANPAVLMKSLLLPEAAHHVGVTATLLLDVQKADELIC